MHPDQDGCPAWCWIAQQDEYDHEVLIDRPTVALHTLGTLLSIRASHYPGRDHRHVDTRGTSSATLEFDLRQDGTAPRWVTIGSRAGGRNDDDDDDDDDDEPNHLILSVDDSRDAVTDLQHLIALANGAPNPVAIR